MGIRMALFTGVLFVLTLVAQYRLWIAEGNIIDTWQLEKALAEQQAHNMLLHQRNDHLQRRVKLLSHDQQGIEMLARSRLGMIKKDEVFYTLQYQDKK